MPPCISTDSRILTLDFASDAAEDDDTVPVLTDDAVEWNLMNDNPY